MRPLRLLGTTLAAASLALPLALTGPLAAGQAASTYTKARVIRVVDGDTIKVDYNRDGAWDDAIRLIGIDTPEHDTCGYQRATRALKSLVRHKVVELRSDSGKTGRQNRPERRVIVPVGSTKVDATTWLLQRGLGVWMPRKDEYTKNLADHLAVQAAAAAGLGWFDEDGCGVGPAANGALSMTVQYQADAAYKLSVSERRNQEFIRIRNNTAEALSIDGWTLRVGNDRRERVPAGGAIPPGETLTIHVGYGTNSLLHRYLGSSVTMLVDADLDGGKHVGGGAYLIDPGGDIRAHMTWPCPGGCPDPTGNALQLSQVLVDPPGPEYLYLNTEEIAVTNNGSVPIRTGDMVIEVSPWVYEFPPDHVLDPGETVRLLGGSGTDDRLTFHLDARNPPLPNEGGRVILRTFDSVVVDCYAWGSERCPSGT